MATATYSPIKTRAGVLYPYAQWYFLLAIVMTWVGFSQSYFAVIRTEPLLHHIHGALMGGWIALLIAQPILYQRGKMRLHRLLGRWGAFALVPAMVVTGCLMVRSMLQNTHLPPFIVNHLAFLDVTSLVQLPVFVGLAIWYGRNLNLHARFIVCTVVVMMPPALARATQLLGFLHWKFALHVNFAVGLMSFILLLLIVDDWRKGKVYAPYPIVFVLNTVVCVAANFANGWGWWHALAGMIARA